MSPYVSCSFKKAVAISFALEGDTPGYILEIAADERKGMDYNKIRQEYSLWDDQKKWLEEFGIPIEIEESSIMRVSIVSFDEQGNIKEEVVGHEAR